MMTLNTLARMTRAEARSSGPLVSALYDSFQTVKVTGRLPNGVQLPKEIHRALLNKEGSPINHRSKGVTA